MKKLNLILIISVLFTVFGSDIFAQTKAFPEAEGFGAYTTGGRGGRVLFVTNLNDSGEGSLRAALAKKYPRIIIFKVSGTIFLQSDLNIGSGNVTVAGQTAPGDGICIAGYPLKIKSSNVIIRYIRCRLGDMNNVEDDAMSAIFHKSHSDVNKNIIIDHCSFSWSTDECLSTYGIDSITVQWCLISESLRESVHSKGNHGYGGIWGGNGASFHHNLLAHHDSRNPRFCHPGVTENAGVIDYRNNVIYNWGINSAYGGETRTINIVNNYYKAGAASKKSTRSRIFAPSEPYGKYYVSGNYVAGDKLCSQNNWRYGIQGKDLTDEIKLSMCLYEPLPFAPVETQSAEEAYKLVLAHCGASLSRDEIDSSVIADVKKGRAKYGSNGIINSQNDVGGYPELKSLPAPNDSDNDGMPDDWEIANNLNPNDANDANAYTLSTEYTNIEMYLNSLVSK